MRDYRKNILGILVILFILSACYSYADDKKGFINVDADEALQMTNDPDVLILDVRTPAEYAQAHIENSVLIPVQVLHTEYRKLKGHENKKILVYCRSGNRSVTASNILIKNGFNHLYNLKSGIRDWVKHRNPVQAGK